MAFTKIALQLPVALLLLACAADAQRVDIESTPGVDFASFKRYSWRVHPVFEKKPELAETYSVGIELVKNAVNQSLMGRGYQSTQQTPDFFITFLLTGKARQDVDVEIVSDMYGWGGWYGWGRMYYPTWQRTVVSNYVEGVLILDFVDAKSS